ncbi:MAG TPA: hypothetical protein VNZ86_02805, partial [Bacteroidia bacterium]|nr:hypothetical protein [Bacteroidia bacterium]
MKTLKTGLICLIVASFMTSCMVTRTNVGAFKETEGGVYTYSKAKQLYLFGLIRISHVSVSTPTSKDCQVK